MRTRTFSLRSLIVAVTGREDRAMSIRQISTPSIASMRVRVRITAGLVSAAIRWVVNQLIGPVHGRRLRRGVVVEADCMALVVDADQQRAAIRVEKPAIVFTTASSIRLSLTPSRTFQRAVGLNSTSEVLVPGEQLGARDGEEPPCPRGLSATLSQPRV